MSSEIFDPQRPAWISVILVFIVSMLGFVIIGPLIGFVLSIPFLEGDLLSLPEKLATPAQYPELRVPLYIMQGCATLFGLIVFPSLYVIGIEKRNITALFKDKPFFSRTLLLTVVVVVVFTIPNSFFIEWNANLVLPDFMKGFETWARQSEDRAAELTTFLTTFTSPGDFLLAFVVIAVLPGIGEELLFRGMLQPGLQKATGNVHAAIWISAILFSSIHLQFFGFVPRLLLGVLFGYLYYWSGNIVVPMLAHFVNNGFSVIMLYLYQIKVITFDMESTEAAPPFMVILFTVITFGILLHLKKFHQEKNTFVQ